MYNTMDYPKFTISYQVEEAIRIHRGSYMSAHVLLNLLNELGRRENARLAEHFIPFSQRV